MIVIFATIASVDFFIRQPLTFSFDKNIHQHAPHCPVARRLYLDLAQPHRQAIVSLIEAAGAMVPQRTPIPQLVEIAALAIQTDSTLLLLDNLDQASDGLIPTVERLIEAADEVALAARTPHKPAAHAHPHLVPAPFAHAHRHAHALPPAHGQFAGLGRCLG